MPIADGAVQTQNTKTVYSLLNFSYTNLPSLEHFIRADFEGPFRKIFVLGIVSGANTTLDTQSPHKENNGELGEIDASYSLTTGSFNILLTAFINNANCTLSIDLIGVMSLQFSLPK
jgi:hypothetical protein